MNRMFLLLLFSTLIVGRGFSQAEESHEVMVQRKIETILYDFPCADWGKVRSAKKEFNRRAFDLHTIMFRFMVYKYSG